MANKVIGEHMAFEHAARLVKAYRVELKKARRGLVICNAAYLLAIGVLLWTILK